MTTTRVRAGEKRVRSALTSAEGTDAIIDALIVQSAKGGGAASDARTALLKHSDDVVTPRLLLALAGSNARVRSAAVEACTANPRRRELTPLGALVERLSDADASVRLSTLVALNRGWGPRNEAVYASQREAFAPALAPLLKDRDTKVAKQAAIVRQRLGL